MPSTFSMFFTASGSLASQPFSWYRLVRSAGEPSSTTEARSLSGCSCHESGGFPPCSRVASTVRAFDPPPPDTAAFLKVTFGSAAVNAVSRTFSASASDPDVHHENTSSVPVPAPPLLVRAAGGLSRAATGGERQRGGRHGRDADQS